MTPPGIGDPSLWAKFGIEGLVIFALFSAMFLLSWLTLRSFSKLDERNIASAEGLARAHREERKEWRESSSRQMDRFENAIARLADGIRDTRK